MQTVQHAVPIEIVAAISQRTHGVVQLPEEVDQVLGKHLGGGSKKGLRADSQALLQDLRSRSRSTSRGGVNEPRPTNFLQDDGQPELPQKVRPPYVQDMVPSAGAAASYMTHVRHHPLCWLPCTVVQGLTAVS